MIQSITVSQPAPDLKPWCCPSHPASLPLPLSPSLLSCSLSLTLPLCHSLRPSPLLLLLCPRVEERARAGAEDSVSVCVRSVCECGGCELIGLELEPASVARFSLPAPSHTHTNTYIHFQQAARGGEGRARLSKSHQPIRAQDRAGAAH